jgi:hypothetical protein
MSTAYKLVDMQRPAEVIRAGMVTFDESQIAARAMGKSANLPRDMLSTDYDVAKPVGLMLEDALDEPFAVMLHRAYYDQADEETYAIFMVECNSHPKGIWCTARVLLENQPDNLKVVENYLSRALTPGCVNPFYPLFVTCEAKVEAGGTKRNRNRDVESWIGCLTVGITHYVCDTDVAVVTMDGEADYWDVARSSLRVSADPKLALALTVGMDHAVSYPKTFKEALKMPDAEQWIEAAEQEVIGNLVRKGTFEFVELKDIPAHITPIPTSMKVKTKSHKDGSLDKRKCRVVANGSEQNYLVDYEEVWAPASQLVSVRIILVIAVCLDLKVYHADVTGAFLNSKLEEVVYATLPNNLPESIKRKLPSMHVRLLKGMYGLKQAGRCWSQTQDKLVMSVPGMQKSKVDPCWYFLKRKGLTVHVLVHVDDYIIATNSKEWKDWFVHTHFAKHYEINDLGVLDQVVGIGVEWGENSVALSRTRDIQLTTEKYGLKDAKSVLYPIVSGFDLPEADVCDNSLSFMNLVGDMRYHERACRPDLSLFLAKLSPFSAKHDARHMEALLKGGRYLKGTADMPLIYRKSMGKQEEFNLVMFTDATWASEPETKRSMSGWVIFLNGNNVSSASKRQDCVALSSTEAEVIAVSEGCKDLIHIYQLTSGVTKVKLPMRVMVDNQATIALLKNPVNNRRSKHIDVRHMWVRELVENGMVSLHYVRTDENIADYLTKPLQGEKFEYFRAQLMGHI